MTATATPTAQARAPRLAAVPADRERLAAVEIAALRAQVSGMQGQFDALAAEFVRTQRRLALAEWQLQAVLSRVGALPEVPAAVAHLAGLEPVEGGGVRRTLVRSALLAECAERAR